MRTVARAMPVIKMIHSWFLLNVLLCSYNEIQACRKIIVPEVMTMNMLKKAIRFLIISIMVQI